MGNIYFPFLTSFGETVRALCGQKITKRFASKTLVYKKGTKKCKVWLSLRKSDGDTDGQDKYNSS